MKSTFSDFCLIDIVKKEGAAGRCQIAAVHGLEQHNTVVQRIAITALFINTVSLLLNDIWIIIEFDMFIQMSETQHIIVGLVI